MLCLYATMLVYPSIKLTYYPLQIHLSRPSNQSQYGTLGRKRSKLNLLCTIALNLLCYALLCNNVSVPSNSIDLLSSTNPSQQAEQPIPVRNAGQEEIKAQLAQSRERRRRGWPFPQVDSKPEQTKTFL